MKLLEEGNRKIEVSPTKLIVIKFSRRLGFDGKKYTKQALEGLVELEKCKNKQRVGLNG